MVGQLGAIARDWTGILTQSREPWVSWLGCVEVGCGYGGLSGRGKKRGWDRTTRVKGSRRKQAVWAVVTPSFAFDDNNRNSGVGDGARMHRDSTACISTFRPIPLTTIATDKNLYPNRKTFQRSMVPSAMREQVAAGRGYTAHWPGMHKESKCRQW